jgi:hypothetical protein
MKTIVALLLMGCLIALCWVAGDIAVWLGKTDGPRAIYAWGLITAVTACLSLLITLTATEMSKVKFKCVCLGGGIACAVACMWAPINFVASEKKRIQEFLNQAPVVTVCGIRHFQEIDNNKDGLLSSSELVTAINAPRLKENRATLQYMFAHVPEIGHLVRSVTSTIKIPMYGPGFKTEKLMYVTTRHEEFAISFVDLNEYEFRMRRRYQSWQ